MKIHLPPEDSAAVAPSTSAQAVPSGYGSSSALLTISSRRSGIMALIPRTAPSSASKATCQNGGVIPHRKSAGIVKIVPEASDELAEPIVCDMFASRIIPPGRLPMTRNAATVSTAMGIDVDTVSPTRRPRYALAAPKRTPKTIPATAARRVNSATDSLRGDGGCMRSLLPRKVGGRVAQRRKPGRRDRADWQLN